MLTAIGNILPDWAVGLVLAAVAWFGVNYVWLAPKFFERKVNCHQEYMFYGDRHITAMAMYTSTFGLSGNADAIAARICNEGKR